MSRPKLSSLLTTTAIPSELPLLFIFPLEDTSCHFWEWSALVWIAAKVWAGVIPGIGPCESSNWLFTVIVPFLSLVQCFITFLLEIADIFKLLQGLRWWTISLDTSLFKEFPGMDCAKTVKKQSKPDNIEPEIERLHQNPDQRTFFYKIQANKAKSQRNKSSRAYLAISSKNVPNDAIKLMLFPYSLKGVARIWYEKEPPNSILTWDDLVNKFINQFLPPSKITHLKNKISCFIQRFKETFGEAWDRFKEMLRACPHHGFSELTQTDKFNNGLHEHDQDSLNATAGGNLLNKTTREALKIIENKSNISNLVEIVNKQVIAPASAKAVEKTCVTCGGAHAYYDCIATDSNQPSVCAETGSYNQINVLRGDFNKQEENLKRNLNNDMRSILGSFFQNQPSTSGTLPSNTVPNPKGSTAQVQPSVVLISISKPDVPRTQPKPTIPYPFADAFLLMPKFASTIKSLLANKDKLFELAKVPLNENCSAMLLKKLPEKLGDPKLTPTRMTLELADRSITRPKGVAEYVFVKVGKFHFPTDFVVVDFEADPRVPLILGRSFLRTGRALIDVYREEITLRVNDESVTFNLNQTMRYSLTYDDNSVNRVDVIDIACEDFVQDVLDFQYNSKSSNPTLVFDPSILENDVSKEPIVKSSSPTLTPFGESDFFLEEIEDFLNDDSILTGIENSVYDPEGDILFI
uniref:Reverse transcriptase domain-containing protein n=1 Tax=Tanacetum cinerariifolium TaxID=118510 RepID=A0A6L2KNF0_TANCI|nr:reverse transcriptase domain-containing protein [Tanacetum cinerariifolium]